MARIFIFGSSSAYGFHDVKGGWAGRLKTNMSQRVLHGERPAPDVLNLAVPARTLPTIIERDVPYAASEANVGTKIGLFLVGPADSRTLKGEDHPHIPQDYFKALLNELGGLCTQHLIHPMFVGATPIIDVKTAPFQNTGDTFRNDTVREYDSMVAEYATANRYTHINTYRPLTAFAAGEIMSDDGLHVNERGHFIVHHLVQGYLEAYMARLYAQRPVETPTMISFNV